MFTSICFAAKAAVLYSERGVSFIGQCSPDRTTAKAFRYLNANGLFHFIRELNVAQWKHLRSFFRHASGHQRLLWMMVLMAALRRCHNQPQQREFCFCAPHISQFQSCNTAESQAAIMSKELSLGYWLVIRYLVRATRC